MKVAKWVGIGLVGLVVLVVVAVGTLHFIGSQRLNQAPEVAVATVFVPDDAESIEHGQYLSNISGCTSCHGNGVAGAVFINEAPIGYIPASNLTTGAGGVGASYGDADWERAIRHGVAADGRTIVTMPSDHYAHYGDDDLGDLIAYLKNAEPVDNELGPRAIQFPGTIIFGMLAYSSWPVNLVDHASVGGQNAPELAPSAEYGEYLVSITSCQSCHAENMAGNYGQSDSPLGTNITPGGSPGNWTLEEFATAMRTGQRPDGTVIPSEEGEGMPWPMYAAMSDAEVEALWTYINTLEPLPNNSAE